MVTKKITRKVISKEKEVVRPVVEDKPLKSFRSKRVCLFCQNNITPTYTDLASLRRFLTDRAKIVEKERSGVCSKHKRAVARNIKYARHLALLPFVPKV